MLMSAKVAEPVVEESDIREKKTLSLLTALGYFETNL